MVDFQAIKAAWTLATLVKTNIRQFSSHALSRTCPGETRPRSRTPTGHRGSDSGEGLGRGRGIPAQYAGRAAVFRPDRSLGRSLLLPNAARGRTALLGAVFRTYPGTGCP